MNLKYIRKFLLHGNEHDGALIQYPMECIIVMPEPEFVSGTVPDGSKITIMGMEYNPDELEILRKLLRPKYSLVYKNQDYILIPRIRKELKYELFGKRILTNDSGKIFIIENPSANSFKSYTKINIPDSVRLNIFHPVDLRCDDYLAWRYANNIDNSLINLANVSIQGDLPMTDEQVEELRCLAKSENKKDLAVMLASLARFRWEDRIFSLAEIIPDDFKESDSIPLAAIIVAKIREWKYGLTTAES